MKKMNFTAAAGLVLFLLFTAAFWQPKNGPGNKNTVQTGVDYTNFIIGMKDKTVYSLRDLADKRFIVLAFLDSSSASAKLSGQIMRAIHSISSIKPGLLWLNLTLDKQHMVINEATSLLKIRYRTLYDNIPRAYDFASRPVILIIDSRGIIRYIYSGYSPTIIDDIKNWLGNAK
jgi:hypothetical protein